MGRPPRHPTKCTRTSAKDQYEIHSTDVRVGDWHGKGYKRADLWDAWAR